MERNARNLRAFRLHSLIAIFSLVLEFVLGMYTALFVRFPESLEGGNAWSWSMSSSYVTMAHIILGTLLILISLSTAGYAIKIKNPKAILASVAGLAMIGLAYASGSIFLSNIERDAYSFVMALGFIGAMLAYGIAFQLGKAEETKAA